MTIESRLLRLSSITLAATLALGALANNHWRLPDFGGSAGNPSASCDSVMLRHMGGNPLGAMANYTVGGGAQVDSVTYIFGTDPANPETPRETVAPGEWAPHTFAGNSAVYATLNVENLNDNDGTVPVTGLRCSKPVNVTN